MTERNLYDTVHRMTTMNEKLQIIYMQVRILRLASEEWNQPIETVAKLFAKQNVFSYIEHCFELFHLQGDDAILEEITAYLGKKGDLKVDSTINR